MTAETPALTPAAQRILDVASELFYRRGIHAVGVDTIAAESGVTKRTLYDRFGSKDALLLAYLQARDDRWRALVRAHVDAAAGRARVLAPFDALTKWLAAGSRGCCFVNAAAELPDPGHPAWQPIRESKQWLRELFRTLVAAEGAPAPDLLARQLLTLHEGALVVASLTGEPTAVADARAAADALLPQRPRPAGRLARMEPDDPDPDRTRAFGEQLLGVLTGGVLTMLIGIGHRTGLFEAAARGPATSDELAKRAGLHERYVREWLGAMVTGGIMEYDPADGRHRLPAAHAALLTGATSRNIGPVASSLHTLGTVLPQVEQCFRVGGGVSIAEYAAVSTGGLGETWRHIYDDHLVDGFLGRVPGLPDRLRAGARVLDLGCGTGHAVNVMAREFPRSTFDGLDIATAAITDADAERVSMGLPNAAFAVADAAELAPDRPYDVIMAFDAIHDQAAPEVVLRRVRDALTPDGVFVMIDTKFATRLEGNVDNPYAALSYGISLLFCVPTSIATGGSGLGAMWGQELAREMLAGSGFTDVQVLDTPRPQNCMYVCRAEAS